ncbi:beta-galactosidase [Roseiflexus castenholzii]|uniref:beta-galactosidase n=1 Tax=Roseiflexus castenholzii TaxID=120962 RepID=UPI0000E765F8|nr:beta-galactosidase [Roseiflexus castenholzii]
MPWCWHEPQPGVFDFTGAIDPQRNLLRFVRLCDSLGLRLILKPGPFVDAELLGGGIPLWLLQNYPEIHARRADGDLWRQSDSNAPRAWYLHPVYLAAARRWIDVFSTAMLPFQHPSGPIIALQADNEIPGDGMLPADVGLDPRLIITSTSSNICGASSPGRERLRRRAR